MQTSRPLILAFVSSSAAFTLYACSGFGSDEHSSPPRPPSSAEGAVDRVDAGPGLPRVGGEGSVRITVNGTLVADTSPGGAALYSTKVVLLDALGIRQEAMTTPEGRFSFPGVQPPYDVSILTGNKFGPQVVLGISSPLPTIEVPTTYEAPLRSSALITLNVQVPSCPEAQCVIQASSASVNGNGSQQTSYVPGTLTVPLRLEHSWDLRGAPERVNVQIFAATNTGSAFWHAQLAVDVTPDGASSVVATMVSVPVFGTLTVTADDSKFSNEWERDLSIYLVLPGAPLSRFPIVRAASSSLVARVPNIPGATLQTSGNLQVRDWTPRPNRLSRYVHSSTGNLPLSTTASTLTFLAPHENVQPASNGNVSAKTGILSWHTPSDQTAFIELDSTIGVDVTIVTNERSIAFDRLYKLGIPELSAGDHYLTLSTAAPQAIDDLVDADALKRRPLGGKWATTLSRFVVTP